MRIGDDTNTQHLTWFLRLATVALAIAILRLAEDVLLPIAFAALLSFLLSPLVARFKHWGLPRTAAIIVTVTLAFGAIGGVGWIVASQAMSLVRELPNYEQNLHRKIVALKRPHQPATVSRITGMVETLQRDLSAPSVERPATGTPAAQEHPPVPVEIKATAASPWRVARDLLAPIVGPLGIAGIVIVFVVAMLFQREDLRDRVIKLVSAGELNVATQALDDAASRVSRYLGMQLVVNASYGVPIGAGLYFIGIPNALLWGLLATLLRFIPFLGPWIAASFPLALAVAVDPGWTKLFYVAGLFVVVELICNNIVEVILYGSSTGISNLSLLIAAVFWTWLWGLAGLALSTPLTVCLLVVGKYVPGLGFLRALLGAEPVLEPHAQFYQRMLSMDAEDMLTLAQGHVADTTVEAFYDRVFLPALLMAEEDRHRGTLSEHRHTFILQASRELVEDLERSETEGAEVAANGEAPATAREPTPPNVLTVPARDEADEIVGAMLAHLLRRRGVNAAVQTGNAPLASTATALRTHPIRAVVVSALPPSTVSSVRRWCRQLHDAQPELPVVAGVWQHRTTISGVGERLRSVRPIAVVTTLQDALRALEPLVPFTRTPGAGTNTATDGADGAERESAANPLGGPAPDGTLPVGRSPA